MTPRAAAQAPIHRLGESAFFHFGGRLRSDGEALLTISGVNPLTVQSVRVRNSPMRHRRLLAFVTLALAASGCAGIPAQRTALAPQQPYAQQAYQQQAYQQQAPPQQAPPQQAYQQQAYQQQASPQQAYQQQPYPTQASPQ